MFLLVPLFFSLAFIVAYAGNVIDAMVFFAMVGILASTIAGVAIGINTERRAQGTGSN